MHSLPHGRVEIDGGDTSRPVGKSELIEGSKQAGNAEHHHVLHHEELSLEEDARGEDDGREGGEDADVCLDGVHVEEVKGELDHESPEGEAGGRPAGEEDSRGGPRAEGGRSLQHIAGDV